MLDRPIFVLGSFVLACTAKVSRFPQPGESMTAQHVTIEPGGKGLNQAMMVRRLGADVDGLLAVGDDLAARFALPALERAGLPKTMLLPLAGETGSGIGFIDAGGETCLAIAPNANLALSAAHVRARAEAIEGAALITAQYEIADAPIREAFALAQRAGVPTLLNPSPFRAISDEILAATSVLIVNESEARSLAASLDLPMETATTLHGFATGLAPAIRGRGPRCVVLTRGAAGAVAVAEGGVTEQPGFPVATVDSLGAGDAFAATFGVRTAQGLKPDAVLREAAAAGALTTTRRGVFDALPRADEIAAVIASTR